MHDDLEGPASGFLRDRFASPGTDCARLARTALSLRIVEPVEAMLEQRLADLETAALADLVVLASGAGLTRFAMRALGRLQPRLTRRATTDLKRRLADPTHDRVVYDVDDRLDAVHDALHPEMCLSALDGPLSALDPADDPGASIDALLAPLLDEMGIAPGTVHGIPMHRKLEFIARLRGNPQSEAQVAAALIRLLGDVGFGGQAPSKRKKTKRKKTKRKKRRRGG